MKSPIFKFLFALLSLALANIAFAADFEAYFNSATGKIVIPHLSVNNQIYYVTLSLTDATNLVFKADPGSLTNLSPPANTPPTSTDPTSIQGTWTVDSLGGISKIRATFKSNGTYEMFQNVFTDCPSGIETGKYSWSPITTLVVISVTSDANGDCGLSHPDGGFFRLTVDGNAGVLREKLAGDNYRPIFITRVGN